MDRAARERGANRPRVARRGPLAAAALREPCGGGGAGAARLSRGGLQPMRTARRGSRGAGDSAAAWAGQPGSEARI